MNPQAKSAPASRVLDKGLLQQAVASLYARLGLKHDPSVTGEQAQDISLRDGVKPEDRIGSSEILRARQEGRE